MRGLRELEEAVGKAIVDLDEAALSTLVKILEGRLAVRLRERERSFEKLIHPSWQDVKVRPKNAMLMLQLKPRSARGRKKNVDISDEQLIEAFKLFKGRGLGDGKSDLSVLREVLLWKNGPGKRTIGKEFQRSLKSLQQRLSATRTRLRKLTRVK